MPETQGVVLDLGPRLAERRRRREAARLLAKIGAAGPSLWELWGGREMTGAAEHAKESQDHG